MKARSIPFAASFGLLFAIFLTPDISPAQTTASNRTEFAYAVNQNSNNLSAFKVGATGALAPLALPTYTTGSAPNGVAIDPTGHFMYVVNVLTNNISGYSIASNGSLTPIPGSPFATGSGPGWITIDPSGKYAYAANCAALCSGTGLGTVSGYAINKTTGALAPVPGSPFTAGNIPYAVAVDPTGSFAYVVNYNSNDISVFKIDQCSGSLWASTESIPTGGMNPLYLTLDPHGRFLYISNTGSSNVSAFAVGSNGTLTPVPGSPFATSDFTQGVSVDSSGSFVYVSAGFEVLGYSIGAAGDLTPLSGSPYVSPGFLVSITVDRTGHFVYAAATSSGVAAYSIDATTGNLTAVTGSPFAAGANTAFVTTTLAH